MRNIIADTLHRHKMASAATVVLGVDQLTKLWGTHALSGHIHRVVGGLGFQLVYDPTSSFSRIPRTSMVLVLCQVLLMVAMLGIARRNVARGVLVASGMVFGGTLSNMADSFLHHSRGVVNVLEVGQYLNFNLADVSVLLGVAILLFRALVYRPFRATASAAYFAEVLEIHRLAAEFDRKYLK